MLPHSIVPHATSFYCPHSLIIIPLTFLLHDTDAISQFFLFDPCLPTSSLHEHPSYLLSILIGQWLHQTSSFSHILRPSSLFTGIKTCLHQIHSVLSLFQSVSHQMKQFNAGDMLDLANFGLLVEHDISTTQNKMMSKSMILGIQ